MNKYPLIASILIMASVMSGCFPAREAASRYPSVQIPDYGPKDYRELLSNKNPEIAYNAICNLMSSAPDIGKLLSDKDADRSSARYIESRDIYTKILALTASKDGRIQAAALRFLQLFTTDYKATGELILPAFMVSPRSPQASYEKVELLCRVAVREFNIDEKILSAFLGDRSWLVSRASYALVDKLESENARAAIIKKYRKTAGQFEKAIMLNAFRTRFSGNDFEFLTGELLRSQDAHIRRAVIGILPGGADEVAVISWLGDNFRKLRSEDLQYLVSSNLSDMDAGFSNRLFSAMLKNGFVPQDDFYEKLYAGLENYEKTAKRNEEEESAYLNLKRLVEALNANPVSADAWKDFNDRKEAENYVDPAFRIEFDAAVDSFKLGSGEAAARFKDEAQALFTKYDIDKDKRDSLMQLNGMDPDEISKR